ncbi:MAG: hypothetical protein HPY83_12505 [Anaerolineae bacterium]|nr:hypothetical protein [Anaerolineae bacterium]
MHRLSREALAWGNLWHDLAADQADAIAMDEAGLEKLVCGWGWPDGLDAAIPGQALSS